MEAMTKQEVVKLIDEGIDHNQTIKELKADVAELKTDVAGLKTDVAGLKTEMTEVKVEQHRQGIMLEELRDNVNLIVEGLSPLLQKSESMGAVDERLDENSEEISVVKTALKSHINNSDIHRVTDSTE